MARQDKVLSMIGLCTKAGQVKSGEYAVETAIKEGKAALVIVAADSSENTREHYQSKCEYYGVPLRIYGTKEELGTACGKELRAALSITDHGMAAAVIGKMEV